MDCGEFSDEEKAEAYMLASRGFIETEDPRAVRKMNQFMSSKPDDKHMKVFSTWREGIKVKLAEHDKTDVLLEKPVPVFTQSKSTDGSVNDSNDARLTPDCQTAGHDHADHAGSPSPGSESTNDKCGSGRSFANVSSHRTLKRLIRYNKRMAKTEDHKRKHWPKPFVVPKVPEADRRFKLFRVFGARKYKPVAIKVRPVKTYMPEEFVVQRNIIGDQLEGMPTSLDPNPPDFIPGECYTAERAEIVEKNHDEGFLLPEEMKIIHDFMKKQEMGFAWELNEMGHFKKEFFPPVKFPVLPHEPWVEKNIPIPPGIFEEVCNVIRKKIDAGVYEPLTSSYRSRWFCVIKKYGKSL